MRFLPVGSCVKRGLQTADVAFGSELERGIEGGIHRHFECCSCRAELTTIVTARSQHFLQREMRARACFCAASDSLPAILRGRNRHVSTAALLAAVCAAFSVVNAEAAPAVGRWASSVIFFSKRDGHMNSDKTSMGWIPGSCGCGGCNPYGRADWATANGTSRSKHVCVRVS